jgi:hypothetical protein
LTPQLIDVNIKTNQFTSLLIDIAVLVPLIKMAERFALMENDRESEA